METLVLLVLQRSKEHRLRNIAFWRRSFPVAERTCQGERIPRHESFVGEPGYDRTEFSLSGLFSVQHCCAHEHRIRHRDAERVGRGLNHHTPLSNCTNRRTILARYSSPWRGKLVSDDLPTILTYTQIMVIDIATLPYAQLHTYTFPPLVTTGMSENASWDTSSHATEMLTRIRARSSSAVRVS